MILAMLCLILMIKSVTSLRHLYRLDLLKRMFLIFSLKLETGLRICSVWVKMKGNC